jgi:phospholipid/cholesterol/gamma-HCH transport system substrate-binding protein
MPMQRMIASAALLAALAVTAVVMFAGRGSGGEYQVHFMHAGLLVEGADVVIGGQKAGSVTEIGLTNAGEADVTVELNRGVPRLRAGTTASLEEPSLSGQANRYVSISPGPETAPELPNGAAIESGATTSVVELDELYNLLDERTRDGLRGIVRGQRDAYAGRAADAERFYETFAPALQASDRLFRELASDGRSLRRFVRATGELAGTLRASSDDLYGAVEESSVAVDGFARASEPLERAIVRMPATFAEGRRAFAEIRESVPAFETLVERARPDLAGLPRFAGALTGALRDERSLEELALLLDGPGARDDLVELLRGLPELSRRGLPAVRSGRPALRAGRPLVDQLRAYTPDLVAFWGNTGRALAPYDANGHYARVLPQFGAFREVADGAGGARMSPLAPAQRLLGLQNGVLRRCPGAASQPLAGAGAAAPPESVECDPSQVPPGP